MTPRRYEVVLSPKAEKQLDELPTPLRRRITEAVEGLESKPRPHGVKKLTGAENLWRIRVGDYRVVYEIEDAIRVVSVTRVGHRGGFYDRLP